MFLRVCGVLLTGMLWGDAHRDATATFSCSPHVIPAQYLDFRQSRDTGVVLEEQASKWKIKEMNNTKLLDMTAELCNSRTALLN